jgi:hypothetical protein
MAAITIDSDTLKTLVYGAVSEAMRPYHEKQENRGYAKPKGIQS